MKLRRVLANVAATAAIAPLALLSAPAAFADGSASPSPSDTVSTPAPPSELPDDTTSASTSTSPTGTPSVDDSSGASASASPSPSDSESTPAESSESPDPSEPPTDPDILFCEDLDKDFIDSKVSADIKGLPGKIVAGDGFHGFELIVTNDSKTDVADVAFYAQVENYELDESKFLSPHVDLEFKNPYSGSWDRIGSDDPASDRFFSVEKLKAGAHKSIDLRVSVDATAPAGDAYFFGSGAYLDNVKGQDCVAEGWAQYDFEVLRSGSSNPEPGDATPSDNGTKDSPKSPQGDATELPGGHLADTGSSSALPVVGLVGGVAVVAGAGAVFAVRRRRADAGA